MQSDLRWKILFVVILTLGCVWAVVPPSEKIRLGLDLKGGIHLVLRVEADDAVKAVLDNRASALRRELRRRNLSFERVALAPAETSLRIVGFDKIVRDEFEQAVESQMPGYTLTVEGDDLKVQIPKQEVQRIRQDAIEDTVERIRVRVDAFGVAEAVVQRQGLQSDRILIQLPGVDDPERVKDLVGKPAFLEYKRVIVPPSLQGASFNGADSREALLEMFGGKLPPDAEIYQTDPSSFNGSTRYWAMSANSPVSGNDLINARTGRGELGSAEVQFTLTADAGKRFEEFTSQNVGKQLSVLLDKKVIQVATIQTTIRESGRITGIDTLQQADDLALKLRSGALPAGTSVLEERTVGPSLGADSIRKGITASLAGLIGSIAFMVFYYKGAGINAMVALILNVLILLGIMSMIGATLTLPGIAGVILTFGMALDANVLIFERIREELRNGKTVRSAVDAGFQKAFGTILDSNVTTVLAAILLFQFGTGPVKGFAFTLIVGLGASMFTAVFVSRLLFRAMMGEKARVAHLSI